MKKRFALWVLGSLGLVLAALYDCDGSDGPGSRSVSSGGAYRDATRVDLWMAHYASWGEEEIRMAHRHRLVVVHPGASDLTREVVRRLQQGADPNDPSDDVLVLGYISVGEDVRTLSLSDEEMLRDPRFAGDGTGPRVDPRGRLPQGGPLEGLDPLGAPSPGGSGYASWYLDDNDHDGRPDRNGKFGGCFVNAGDPKWFDTLQDMRSDEPGGRAGLREILTTSYARGLGCDGVFLDTIDTCAPNRFTDPSHENFSQFEWTAPGFRAFIRRLRAAYPRALILQNRGLFFFDPRHPHYAFNARGLIDFAIFESFRLNSNVFETFNAFHYPDNRHNIAPKLMAEADRPDGFQVLSIGYAAGPGISEGALRGAAAPGREELLEDLRAAHAHGFRHFLTTERVRAATFVADHADFDDRDPPVWSSTYNVDSSGGVPAAPTPRVGLQEAVPAKGGVTVRWDVALDLHPVRYALYLSEQPFDFDADPALGAVRRVELVPEVGDGYAHAPDRYPYQATVGGLSAGTSYHLLLRAFDALGNEEQNRVVRTVTPF